MTIQVPKKFRILLIGDNGVDIYQYGNVDRMSPEAPVPVFVPTHKEERPGMAGNVYANLVALGCDVDIVSGHISKKTRLIDSRSKQQIARIDEDAVSIPVINVDSIDYDAVVISDYNKGVVSYELIESLIKTVDIPIFIDTKKQDLARMHGCFVKINEQEYKNLWSINNQLIVTLGSQGAMYKTGRDPRYETMYSCPEVEVVDITGAGDTFLAAFAFEFLRSQDHVTAIIFANRAASVTVQHFGCYAPTLEEIQ